MIINVLYYLLRYEPNTPSIKNGREAIHFKTASRGRKQAKRDAQYTPNIQDLIFEETNDFTIDVTCYA